MKREKTEDSLIDRLLRSKVFLTILFVVGVLVFVYPLISDRYYSIEQDRRMADYEQAVEGLTPEEEEQILAEARAYNNRLAGISGEMYSPEYMEAMKRILEDGELPEFFSFGKVIGTLRIPKIQVDLPIYSGTSESILQKSAGYLIGTSLPVGGESTHSVITAHRGLPQARLFTDLDKLERGDLFLIKVLHRNFAYRVDSIKIIRPTDTSHLSISSGEDIVTLLTCHPFMINSHRMLVRGHRVPYTPEIERKMAIQEKDGAWELFFAKYKEYIIGIIVFLLITVVTAISDRRKLRKKQFPQ